MIMEFLASFWMPLVMSAVIAYLLGSINFAIVVTKFLTKSDIREYGSGNAGATNVLRSQGKGAAVLTTIGDLGKSMLSVWIGGWLITHMNAEAFDQFIYQAHNITAPVEDLVANGYAYKEQIRLIGNYVAGLFCILGHLYPLYFGFRGGKGVMATLGMMLVLDWRVALISLGMFIVVVAIGRMVSLGSIMAGITMVICTFLFRAFVDDYPWSVVWLCTIMALIIVVMLIFKHLPNIKRILNGTENKVNFHKKDGESAG